MDKVSEAILALKPVTFHYKSDSTGTPQFGLIAEDVAVVNPDLVVRDKNGEIYTVRYDQVNAMLLNEFLKEHRKVDEQQATITHLQKDLQAVSAEQQKDIQLLRAQLKQQAAQIQKVSVQLAAASPSGGGLEASRPAPQVVNNP
jgi:cytochrome c biogenesis protein ResB